MRSKTLLMRRTSSSASASASLQLLDQARQREFEQILHRVMCTGRSVSPEQARVFADVSAQPAIVARLMLKQEELELELERDVKALASTFGVEVRKTDFYFFLLFFCFFCSLLNSGKT